MSLPQMLARGYNPRFAAGLVVAAGTLGIIIPPSVLLILYGFIAGVSVPRLYAAAFIPGFLLAGLYVVYIIVRAARDPKIAGGAQELSTASSREVFLLFIRGLVPILSLILFVLGAIFFGFATPSEGAALGALGGLILAAFHRRLSFQMLKESVFLTVRTASIVGWLLVGSSIFAAVFALLGSAQLVGDFLLGLGLPDIAFVFMVQVIIFVLGWPLEWTEIVIIFIPLFLPVLIHLGVDLVWFGVLSAVNMQTAFLSPPVAMSAYYLKNVAPKHITLNMIFSGMYPFIGLQLIALALLYAFPQMATWLPDLVYGAR
jgi:tripartite ATP-independent transporter DctM subunit